MARALLGYVGNGNERLLAFEVTRLRKRVAELESELAKARAELPVELDLELRHIAEASTPALA
jgi:uncharacterized small protein (DUF1192 family)